MIRKLKVTVDGKTYDVSVDVPDEPKAAPKPPAVSAAPPVPSPAAPAAAQDHAPAPRSTAPGDVVSPLAGRVVSIGVEPGQDVREGDHVLTLEAMKMNTFVFAPKTGKIKDIKTAVGAAVQEGDVLLAME